VDLLGGIWLQGRLWITCKVISIHGGEQIRAEVLVTSRYYGCLLRRNQREQVPSLILVLDPRISSTVAKFRISGSPFKAQGKQILSVSRVFKPLTPLCGGVKKKGAISGHTTVFAEGRHFPTGFCKGI